MNPALSRRFVAPPAWRSRRVSAPRGLGLALTVFVLGLPSVARASVVPGTPVRGFGHGGVVEVRYPNHSYAEPQRVFAGGGQVVVVGSIIDEGTPDSGDFDTPLALAFNASGARDPGFGRSFAPLEGEVADAARLPGGRVAAVFNRYPPGFLGGPTSTGLVGLDRSGRRDPTFADRGVLDLGAIGPAAAILRRSGGELFVVGVDESDVPAGGDATPGGVYLLRVSASGRLLGRRTLRVNLDFEQARVTGMVPTADGGVLVVGTDPDLFLARFTPAGVPDLNYGPGGIRHAFAALPAGTPDLRDVALDRSGRILVVGSVDDGTPLAPYPVLVRIRTDATKDDTLAPLALTAPTEGLSVLTRVEADRADKILLMGQSGVLARLDSDGRPDVRFGAGGVDIRNGGGPTFATSLTVAGASAFAGGPRLRGENGPLALERVHLTGQDIAPLRARKRIHAKPLRGRVSVRMPLIRRGVRLRGTVALPLAADLPPSNQTDLYPADKPDVPIAPAEVDANRGAIQLFGVHGSATIAHGTVSPRAAQGRVMELDLAGFPCNALRTTTVRLHGAFVMHAGLKVIRNRTQRALFTVRQPCGRPLQVHVRRGRLTVRRPAHRP